MTGDTRQSTEVEWGKRACTCTGGTLQTGGKNAQLQKSTLFKYPQPAII